MELNSRITKNEEFRRGGGRRKPRRRDGVQEGKKSDAIETMRETGDGGVKDDEQTKSRSLQTETDSTRHEEHDTTRQRDENETGILAEQMGKVRRGTSNARQNMRKMRVNQSKGDKR